jgi:hypothetical protein
MTFLPAYPPVDEALRNHLLRAPTAANQIRCKLFLSSLLRQHISKLLFPAGETVSYAYMAKTFLISRRILYIRIFQICVKSRVQTRPLRHSPLYGDGDLQVTPSRKWAASRETDDGRLLSVPFTELPFDASILADPLALRQTLSSVGR